MKIIAQISNRKVVITLRICDALRDLVPFVQFKKREKHPRRSVTFSEVALLPCNFTKSNTPRWVFSRFLNCLSDIKSRKVSHIITKF